MNLDRYFKVDDSDGAASLLQADQIVKPRNGLGTDPDNGHPEGAMSHDEMISHCVDIDRHL